jgi:hypothetical protein
MRNAFNIAVVRATSLEAGDLIAHQVTRDSLISGKISAVVYFASDLTRDQCLYMEKHDLRIPEEHPYACEESSLLVFGDFAGSGKYAEALTNGHMYLNTNSMVAVFMTDN